MSELIGKTLIHRYQILSLLGEGGMGSVYKGRDLTLERDVAIKIMHRHNLGKQEFQQRFLQEARAAARLNHPGIVQVFDFGEADDLLFIVMEFILGENLDQMIRRLRRKGQWIVLAEATELVRQIALALDYGHRQGVVHRDIKPANIMIKAEPLGALPYRPVITDLGLAKLMIGEGLATQTGLTMGTPAYMAPEQIRGGNLDARSDIYSLGILLYELAVGQLPFAVKTFTQIVHDHLHEPPPDPQTLAPALPSPVVSVMMKALAKIPNERYSTAGDLAQALEELPSTTFTALVPPTASAGIGSLLTEHHAVLLNDAELLDLLERLGPRAVPERSGPLPYLRICTPDQRIQAVALTTARVTIGRQVDNTVSLDDDKISRYHAELTHDEAGYWITDLDSTNGLYLGDERLQPHARTLWDPELPLRIGSHVIFLHPEGTPAVDSDAVFKSTTDEMPRVLAPLLATPMTLMLAQSEYVVAPGQSVQIPITLHNQSNKSEQFFLTVAGIPRAWIVSPLPTTSLSPGAQQTVTLTIAPPRAPETTAQPLPLQIRVNSQQAAGLHVQTQCLLHISPYTQFQSAVFWGQGRRGRHLTVHIANQGNAPQVYQIAWHDTGGTLALEPPLVTIQAPPGKEVMTFCKVQPQPQHRRLVGLNKQYTIQTRVLASDGESQAHDLAYINRPLLPAWLALLVGLLSITLLGGLGWYLRDLPAAPPSALATLAPLQASGPTATVVAVATTVAAPTATVAATATPPPPTPTLAPPTATPLPPTPTPVPPTATPALPTATVEPPTPALTLTTALVTAPVTSSNSLSVTAPVAISSTVALTSSLAISVTAPLSAAVAVSSVSPLATPTLPAAFPLLSQGFMLTNAASDGQRDLLILSKPTQDASIEWRWFESLPAAELDPLRSTGYYVVQLLYHQQRWGVGLALTPGYTDQLILSGTDFPQAELRARSDQGFYVTQLAYGNNQWVVVLSQGAGFGGQTWNLEVSFPADVIDGQRAEGYALTQLAYGNGIWVVVMTKGVGLQDQEFLTGELFPEGPLRQKQAEGKFLTQLVYSDSLWVAVVSAGADVSEQIWVR